VSGNVGTSAVGSVTINAQANDTFAPVFLTGVESTGEIGTASQQETTPAVVTSVGTVTITTTVIPTNATVTDFVDEG
jgi:hypothetical protein